MNTVAISGRLVYEPEIRLTTSGASFLSTRIAVNRNDKNKTSDFFNVKAWNSTAKFIGQYFHKGDPIEIRGRLETSYMEKQDGTKSTETYILADEVSFCLRPIERDQAPKPTTETEAPKEESVISESIEQLIDGNNLPFEL